MVVSLSSRKGKQTEFLVKHIRIVAYAVKLVSKVSSVSSLCISNQGKEPECCFLLHCRE